jgi:hypothetical protein
LPVFCPNGSISLHLLGPGLFDQKSRKLIAASGYQQFISIAPKTTYTVRIPVVRLRGHASALTAIQETETMPATVTTPMITPTLLRARSLDEPSSGMPHAGISEGAVGQPAVLS